MKKLIFVALIAVLLISFIGCAPSAKSDMPIVLITDYGYEDYRVPQVKGIIYNTYPYVEIIDGTHGIPNIDIATGAFILDLTAREFPSDVIFLAGVGSRPSEGVEYLVLLTDKDQIFVAVNNGILTNIINEFGIKKLYSITNEDLYDRSGNMLSSHYILARIAALIASGQPLEDVGPEVSNPVMLDIQKASVAGDTVKGSVVFVDHFGNCLTNISGADCAEAGLAVGDTLQVTINGQIISVEFGLTYSSVGEGEAVAFLNSLDSLQLSLNMASFASTYELSTGARVEITK